MTDAAVKKLIKISKKRGYMTIDQLNGVLPSEEVSAEQLDDIMTMLSEMGINLVEEEDAEEEAASRELTEGGEKAVVTTKKREPTDRTDDPVRMYLREMGTVELLSREGEISIAKRIEAGRETGIILPRQTDDEIGMNMNTGALLDHCKIVFGQFGVDFPAYSNTGIWIESLHSHLKLYASGGKSGQ